MPLTKRKLAELANSISSAIDNYVYPGLTPRDQSELIAMVLRKDLDLKPSLMAGRVWITDRQVNHPLIRNNAGMKFLPDHFWVEVENQIILDYTFGSIIDQEHESIPHGIFTKGSYKGFLHQMEVSIRYRSTDQSIQKLRLKGKNVSISNLPE